MASGKPKKVAKTTRPAAARSATAASSPGRTAAAKATPVPKPVSSPAPKYRTMAEFWPFYLHEHSRPGTRALHLIGTAVALSCIVLAFVLTPWFLLAGLVAGYAFAWVAHYFVEHNRPATFTYPFKSFAADWVMFGAFLSGQLGKQLSKHGVRAKS